jgi:glycerate kinase
MKIVIATDSFKGSLSSAEAAKAIENGIKKVSGDIETLKIPMADGGEGTVAALIEATGGRFERVTVKDPLLRDTASFYGILGDGRTAVIEMAAASGLPLLSEAERDPLTTSTYGTGQLILDALGKGCRKFIIGLGGSATNDGGTGMAAALGYRFLDSNGNDISPGGGALAGLRNIDASGADGRIKESEFVAACDVENPLTGPWGASAVFGPQKGASPGDVASLDSALGVFAEVLHNWAGIEADGIPGSGAAGGMGAGVIAFLGARLAKGFDIVASVTSLREKISGADLVITGEGRTDIQTLMGKAPGGVARLSKEAGIPVIAISGSLGSEHQPLFDAGFTALFSIADRASDLAYLIENASELLEKSTENIIRTIIQFRNTL